LPLCNFSFHQLRYIFQFQIFSSTIYFQYFQYVILIWVRNRVYPDTKQIIFYNIYIYKFWSFHFHFPSCDTVYSYGRIPTFRRKTLLQISSLNRFPDRRWKDERFCDMDLISCLIKYFCTHIERPKLCCLCVKEKRNKNFVATGEMILHESKHNHI
jgi:hypothetical protein